MTRRDLQRAMGDEKKPWEVGKSFDHSAVLGPLQPFAKTGHFTQGAIWLKVNGQVKQNANLNQMIWNVAEQVANLSKAFELMRIVDIQLSFPAILIALILIAVLGQGTGKVIAALVTVQWAYYARTVRSAALVEKRKEYIEAARCLALVPSRIVFRHLLPNCLPPLMVVATVQVAAAIALEATLSFLGLGLPITEPSLGLLIANGYQYLLSGKYWISFFPGVALLVTIVSINLVADQLRDVLNPRLQR